jgi:hypothetical protein
LTDPVLRVVPLGARPLRLDQDVGVGLGVGLAGGEDDDIDPGSGRPMSIRNSGRQSVGEYLYCRTSAFSRF